jgi:hypothetical protein
MDDVTNMTTEQVQAEITATLGDQGHAYWRGDDPGHQAAVDRAAALYRKVNGDPDPAPTRAEREAREGQATQDAPVTQDDAARATEVREFVGSLPQIEGGYHEGLVGDVLQTAETLGADADVARSLIAAAITCEHGKVKLSEKDGRAQLVKDLGEDGAEEALTKARFLYDQLPASLQAYLIRTGGANSPAIIKALAQHGESPLKAREAADRIIDAKDSGYFDADHPNHKKAVEQVRKLMQKAYGGK